MGLLFRLLLLGVFATLAAAPFVLLQSAPVVTDELALDAAQIREARRILRSLFGEDESAGRREVRLSEADVDLALHAVLEALGGGAAEVSSEDGQLVIAAASRLPLPPDYRFLNFTLILQETPDRPEVLALRLGRLDMPRALAGPALGALIRLAAKALGLPAPEALLHHAQFAEGALTLQYDWSPEIVDAVRKQVIPEEEAARLREFQQVLAAALVNRGGKLGVSDLAAPLFAHATSRAATGDPVADNRAILIVLSAYVTGRDLRRLLPEAATWPQPVKLQVRLYGRADLAKHYLNSAALAATGGELLSKALGLSKEISDSQGGSGFSFRDLLADEAGTRFGQRATESRVVAREYQARAAQARDEAAWMPSPEGLEENMTQAQFEARYGGVGGAGYERTLAGLRRRLQEASLLR